jgi:hypothetical protein
MVERQDRQMTGRQVRDRSVPYRPLPPVLHPTLTGHASHLATLAVHTVAPSSMIA